MAKNRRRRSRVNPAPCPTTGGASKPAPHTASGVAPKPAAAGPLFGYPLPAALPPVALLLMVVGAYLPALFADFVWDDKVFLDAAPIMTTSGLWDLWFVTGSLPFEGHYWPLVYTTIWLEHKLWGFNPLPFHLTNILLHSGISVLMWRLLLRMEVAGAWLIAAVFALHPVHVEAVAWVIARKDLLATLFYLLAAREWLRFRERQGPGVYLIMLALFVAGMLSKSFVITLPASLLVWAWWREGRVTGRDVLHTAPLFVVGFAIVAFDLVQYSARASTDFDFSLLERSLIAAKALWFYAYKLLWPDPLMVNYPLWDDISPANALNWLPLLAAIALAAGLWLARHRIGRGPLAGALFFAVTLSPMLGFGDNAFMQFSYVADRYQYLGSAGLIAVSVAAVVTAWRWLMTPEPDDGQSKATGVTETTGVTKPTGMTEATTNQATPAGVTAPAAKAAPADMTAPAPQGPLMDRVILPAIAYTLPALLLLGYGALTFRHAQTFENEVVLFSHVIKHNDPAYHVYFNYGNALMAEGSLNEAAEALTTAVERDPDTVNIHINLGVVRMQMEQYPQAEEAFRQATILDPDNFQAYQNLGAALRRQQRFNESLQAMQTAVELSPSPPPQHYHYMGLDAVELGWSAEAERYFRLALQADPDHTDARRQLVFIYLNSKRYQAALELDPGLRNGLDPLAYEYFTTGRVEQALEIYRHITALDPESAAAHANLGAALAQSGRYQEALITLERALTLDPQQPSALTNIELVRQRLGQTSN